MREDLPLGYLHDECFGISDEPVSSQKLEEDIKTHTDVCVCCEKGGRDEEDPRKACHREECPDRQLVL
jgi:hypothetical protein